MSGVVGPRFGIVQDGLVLNLDASNTLSYPGSGTTWFDLTSNNNDGTLVNGPTFDSANGGSIVFDGINDYVSFTTPPSTNSGTEKSSINVWIKTGTNVSNNLKTISKVNSKSIFVISPTTFPFLIDGSNSCDDEVESSVPSNLIIPLKSFKYCGPLFNVTKFLLVSILFHCVLPEIKDLGFAESK